LKENPNKAASGVMLDRLQLLCGEGDFRNRYGSIGSGLKVHDIEPHLHCAMTSTQSRVHEGCPEINATFFFLIHNLFY
jgi:hypothetical protein